MTTLSILANQYTSEVLKDKTRNSLLLKNLFLQSVYTFLDRNIDQINGVISDSTDENNGKTLLHLAAENGDLSFINLLLKKGEGRIRLDLKDSSGKTPLQLVATLVIPKKETELHKHYKDVAQVLTEAMIDSKGSNIEDAFHSVVDTLNTALTLTKNQNYQLTHFLAKKRDELRSKCPDKLSSLVYSSAPTSSSTTTAESGEAAILGVAAPSLERGTADIAADLLSLKSSTTNPAAGGLRVRGSLETTLGGDSATSAAAISDSAGSKRKRVEDSERNTLASMEAPSTTLTSIPASGEAPGTTPTSMTWEVGPRVDIFGDQGSDSGRGGR
jgi:hypothetical protein